MHAHIQMYIQILVTYYAHATEYTIRRAGSQQCRAATAPALPPPGLRRCRRL